MVIDDELNEVFVTGCTHLGHENIIKYCSRPFRDVGEMDKTMIANWNEVVSPGDLVFHLGDFTLGNRAQAKEYFGQLNGDIRILANSWHHDKYWLAPKPGLDEFKAESKSGFPVILLSPMVVLEVSELGQGSHPLGISLCHYPLAVWDRKHFGAWHLHSHCHGKHPAEGKMLDVGVDCMNFYPISLGGVLEFMYEVGGV